MRQMLLRIPRNKQQTLKANNSANSVLSIIKTNLNVWINEPYTHPPETGNGTLGVGMRWLRNMKEQRLDAICRDFKQKNSGQY